MSGKGHELREQPLTWTWNLGRWKIKAERLRWEKLGIPLIGCEEGGEPSTRGVGVRSLKSRLGCSCLSVCVCLSVKVKTQQCRALRNVRCPRSLGRVVEESKTT